MYQVERHVIKDNRYEEICHKSGLLYNYCLYAFRQGVFTGNYIKEYELSTKLGKENQYDFRNLPCHVSRNVIKQVSENIKSWIRAKKEYEKHPDKFQRRPKLPDYKNGKKLNIVVFDELSCRIKEDGCVHFVKNIIKPIRTKVKPDELIQIRIIPEATCFIVEIVYERKETDLGLDKDNFLSIDLGLNNLCACVSNVVESFIINGKIAKSVNQWYNKKKAKLMSFVGNKGTSNKIKRITLLRNCWIEDKLHKISRYIVNFCRSNNIGTIIIGLNKGWKNKINIGKRNNQHFVSIPHSKLINKIVYKAKLLGINVIIHEESYTSKIDHLAFEPLKKQESYLGKRKKRGLFQFLNRYLLFQRSDPNVRLVSRLTDFIE